MINFNCPFCDCGLYTSDAADEEDSVTVCGRRIIDNEIVSGVREAGHGTIEAVA